MLIGAGDWMDHGACRGADPAIFLPGDAFDEDDGPHEPSAEASAYCTRCDVQADCLTHAFVLHLSGIWGNTTAWQREKLRRPLSRKICPVCSSRNLNVMIDCELCLDCGTSWRGAQ